MIKKNLILALLNNKKAFTLIEILVAMTIFALVLTMASMGFAGVFKNSARINLQRKLQEDSRFLIERIVKDLRNSQLDFASHHVANNFECGPDSGLNESDCYAAYNALPRDQVIPGSVAVEGENQLYLLSADGKERTVYTFGTAQETLFRLVQTYQDGNWNPALTEEHPGSKFNPEEINISSIKFLISPVRDPHRFNEVSEIQVQPTVTIILQTQLNTASDKVPDFFLGEAPQLALQTTITSRYYNSGSWQETL